MVRWMTRLAARAHRLQAFLATAQRLQVHCCSQAPVCCHCIMSRKVLKLCHLWLACPSPKQASAEQRRTAVAPPLVQARARQGAKATCSRRSQPVQLHHRAAARLQPQAQHCQQLAAVSLCKLA